MAVPKTKLDLLWHRLEDAKLQLEFALSYLKEIRADQLCGDIPAPDGYYALRNALAGEEEAVTRYLCALHDLKAALALDRVPNGASPPVLTPRERQVLALIAQGKTSKEIAAELGMAFRTAVCHRYRVQTKLNAHNTADLTRAALRMGLVEL